MKHAKDCACTQCQNRPLLYAEAYKTLENEVIGVSIAFIGNGWIVNYRVRPLNPQITEIKGAMILTEWNHNAKHWHDYHAIEGRKPHEQAK